MMSGIEHTHFALAGLLDSLKWSGPTQPAPDPEKAWAAL
jgi:hypothetical protein